jgi:hypothetical protein
LDPILPEHRCAEGVEAWCSNNRNIEDTDLCGGSERSGMPFAITVAPLDKNGNVPHGENWVTISSHDTSHNPNFTAQRGTGRYSFAIVPRDQYVPTEADGCSEASSDYPDGQCPTDCVKTLQVFDGEATDPLKSSSCIEAVLKEAGGAYVEGVLRFTESP